MIMTLRPEAREVKHEWSSPTDTLLGGLFLTQPIYVPNLKRIPSTGLLTVSKCLATFVPDDWVYITSGDRMAEKVERAKDLGIPASDLEKLTIWCTKQFKEQTLGWPNVIFDIETAKELVKQLSVGPTFALLGIGLPFEITGQFFENANPDSRSSHDETQGVPTLLQRGLVMPSGGSLLGFEALGYESDGTFHSSKCYHIKDHSLSEPTFNLHGYCATLADAKRLCEIYSKSTAQQIGWLPWEIRQYSL
jgi:hypothetical protein